MKKQHRKVLFSVFAYTFWPIIASSAYADEIDRVLVAVNGRIIAESDLRVAQNQNSLLLFGQAPGEAPSRRSEISRLVDLELIRQELENYPIAPDDQSGIDSRMADLKKGYAEIGGLADLLKRLDLQESELETYIRLQASIMRFVSLRFTPFVTVTREEVQAYYLADLAPAAQKAGIPVPALDDAAAEIEKIIRAKKTNESLENWIRDLRKHSRIEFFGPGVDAPPPASARERGERMPPSHSPEHASENEGIQP